MRKLTAYNFISLNGFFKGPNEDIRWHQHREEQAKYSEESLAADNIKYGISRAKPQAQKNE